MSHPSLKISRHLDAPRINLSSSPGWPLPTPPVSTPFTLPVLTALLTHPLLLKHPLLLTHPLLYASLCLCPGCSPSPSSPGEGPFITSSASSPAGFITLSLLLALLVVCASHRLSELHFGGHHSLLDHELLKAGGSVSFTSSSQFPEHAWHRAVTKYSCKR